MKIITIAHPTLRQKATPITEVNEQLMKFITELETTLMNSRNPRGVGLAAPQVDKLWRVFTTNFPLINKTGKTNSQPAGNLRYFINPVIHKTCQRKKVLGVNPKEADLEGCLSMPGLYGPVPRHRWVELEYQLVETKSGKLIHQREKFADFAARVIQHELDHLDGILFTDHALKNNLPVYRQSENGQDLVEIDPELIKAI